MRVSAANLQRRAIGRAIRSWREASGMSGFELSKKAGWSTAKMSMMQNAVCPIFGDDVLVLAMILGIDEATRRLVYRSAQRAHDPAAWDHENPGVPRLGWTLAELEAEASGLRILATETLPPLFQTRAYAEAWQAAQAVAASETVAYSQERSEATLTSVTAPNSLRLHLVVTEAVLRRLVGGARVMADQLTWLLQLTGRPGTTVQVVPDDLGAYPGIGTGFTILTFIEKHFDDVVFVQQLHGALWLESAEDCVPHEKTFNKLTEVALPPPDSRELIAEMLLLLQDRAAFGRGSSIGGLPDR